MSEINDTHVKVLFVDDEQKILNSLKRLLMDEDFEVITANSGEDALKIIPDNKDIGLIVSDQRMPGLTGVDFLEQAKKIAPDALRMVLTGYADIKAAMDAINKGGAYRYIAKPWKDKELVQTIRDAVRHYLILIENKRLTDIVKKQNEEIKQWNSQLEYYVQEQTLEIQNKNKELQGLNERLKNNFKNTIAAFSNLLELRDRRARNHSRNVAGVSVSVAKELGLSGKEIESIAIASLLHDIGKIGMSDVMLLKDLEDMNSEEMKEYFLHPVRGQAAIDSIENLRAAGTLIRHHHEWYNGFGFPDRLQGEEIPPGSRIMTMADFVDRSIGKMQCDNAIELALNEVKKGIGKRFDPQLYSLIEKYVTDIYTKNLPKTGAVEMELNPENLEAGMTISRDVRSGTDVLILSKGIKLNQTHVQSLRRYRKLDPSKGGVFVWVKNR